MDPDAQTKLEGRWVGQCAESKLLLHITHSLHCSYC